MALTGARVHSNVRICRLSNKTGCAFAFNPRLLPGLACLPTKRVVKGYQTCQIEARSKLDAPIFGSASPAKLGNSAFLRFTQLGNYGEILKRRGVALDLAVGR